MNEHPTQQQPTLERYPVWVVLIANLVPFSIYLSGFLIMIRLGWVVGVSYLIFVAILEFRVVSRHCVNCYYWGKLACKYCKQRELGCPADKLFNKNQKNNNN